MSVTNEYKLSESGFRVQMMRRLNSHVRTNELFEEDVVSK